MSNEHLSQATSAIASCFKFFLKHPFLTTNSPSGLEFGDKYSRLSSHMRMSSYLRSSWYFRPISHLRLSSQILEVLFKFEVVLIFEIFIFEVIFKFEIAFIVEVVFIRLSSYLRLSSYSKCIKCSLVVFSYSPDTIQIPSWYCFKLFRSADETTRRRDKTRWDGTRRKQW